MSEFLHRHATSHSALRAHHIHFCPSNVPVQVRVIGGGASRPPAHFFASTQVRRRPSSRDHGIHHRWPNLSKDSSKRLQPRTAPAKTAHAQISHRRGVEKGRKGRNTVYHLTLKPTGLCGLGSNSTTTSMSTTLLSRPCAHVVHSHSQLTALSNDTTRRRSFLRHSHVNEAFTVQSTVADSFKHHVRVTGNQPQVPACVLCASPQLQTRLHCAASSLPRAICVFVSSQEKPIRQNTSELEFLGLLDAARILGSQLRHQ